MEKHYRHFSTKSLMILAALLIGFYAQAQEKNITEMQLGVEYSGDKWEDAYFSFTPTEDGKLVVTGNEVPDPFTDATFTEGYGDYTFSYVPGGKEIEMTVTKGNTYYLAMLYVSSAWKFTARMADASTINIVSTNHPVGEVFPLGEGGFLSVTFDTAIQIGTIKVETGNTIVETSGIAYGKDVSIELKDILFPWLQNGTMKAGDIFTVTISDVKSAYNPDVLYNGDGIVSLSFISSAKPAEVVSENLPAEFLSYWPVNAESGIATIEYDTELATDRLPSATISFGSAEVEGDYYSENLPVEVIGKTLTVDFRGKRRIPTEMVASGTDYGTMRLSVNNIRSVDGNYVYAEGQGTYGSFQHEFTYRQLTTDLTTEFTPASGASLTGVSSVELWLSNPDAITFDGVQVDYKSALGMKETVTYTKEECNYKNEGADGIILNIPITADMQTGTNVTITLTNIVSQDGIAREISAIYNPKEEFIPTAIEPANESQIETLDYITFTYDTDVTIIEGVKAQVMSVNGRQEITTGSFVASKFDSKVVNLTFETPVTEVGYYKVLVPAGALSNATGEQNEAMVLNYEVVAPTVTEFILEPADGSTVENLSTIFVNYADGFGVSWNYDAELKDAAGNVVAKVFKNGGIEELWPESWDDPLTRVKLTLQDPTTQEPITITTPGTYTLEIPQGFFNIGTGFETEDSKAITATYTIEGGTAPAGLQLVSTFPEMNATISSEDAYMVQFVFGEDVTITEDAVAYIMDQKYNGYTATVKVYPMTPNTATVMNFTDENGTFHEYLPNGSYMVQLAEGSVTNANGDLNETLELMFTVGEATPVDPSSLFTFTPAAGSTVANLYEIYIEHSELLAPNWNGQAQLLDAEGNVVATGDAETFIPADKQEDYDNWQYDPVIVKITLSQPITVAGTYTLSLPEGYLIYGMDNLNSPAIEVTYTVATTTTEPLILTSTNPQDGGSISSEDAYMIQFVFDEDIIITEDAIVYVMDQQYNGYTATVKVYPMTPNTATVMNFTDENGTFHEYLPDGSYLVQLAEGSVAGVESGRLNETIEISFTVGEATPVDPSSLFTFTPSAGSSVESLYEIYIEHSESLNANLGVAELKDAEGNVVATGSAETYIPADKQEDYDNWMYEPVIVKVTLNQEVTTEGTYTLSMPEGFLIYSTDYINSPAMEVTYTIGTGDEVLTFVSSNPEMNATVKEEDAYMIQFFFNEDVQMTTNVSVSIVDDSNNNYTATVKVYPTTPTAATVMNFYNSSFKFFENLPLATYTVTLAAGSVEGIASGKLNEDIEITFTVNDEGGLSSLFGDEVARYDVYTINGVRVMSTTDKQELNELKSGFYIINGKKIYLRK